jgi:mannosyl-3-phosphoglycerate phosphatase
MKKNYLISTDLDGTFLGHEDFDYKINKIIVSKIVQKNIPIIFNTSKTFDEVIDIKNELKIYMPFIVENGSGIFFPTKENITKEKYSKNDFQLISSGPSREDIINIINSSFSEFTTFFDLSNELSKEDLQKISGLPYARLKNLLNRQFSELIVWKSDEKKLQDFKYKLSEFDLSLTKGARFLHLKGQSNKGTALKKLLNYMKKDEKVSNYSVIALGDSENDVEMLQMSDHPFLIKIPNRDFIKFKGSNKVRKSTNPAPIGWKESLLSLDDFNKLILEEI